MSGLEIVTPPESNGQQEIKFVLRPGQTKLIELKSTNIPWKLAHGIAYGIR